MQIKTSLLSKLRSVGERGGERFRVFAVVFGVLALFGSVWGMVSAQTGNSVSIAVSGKQGQTDRGNPGIRYGWQWPGRYWPWYTNWYIVDGQYDAMCLNPDKERPNGGSSQQVATDSNGARILLSQEVKRIMAVTMQSANGGDQDLASMYNGFYATAGWSGIISSFGGWLTTIQVNGSLVNYVAPNGANTMESNQIYALGHAAVGASLGMTNHLDSNQKQIIRNLISSVNSYFDSNSGLSQTLDTRFNGYRTEGGRYQDIGWLEPVETHTHTVRILKYSSDSGALLAGASFSVYENQCSGTPVATLTTSSDASNNVITLQPSSFPQTYCVQETSAPSGYVATTEAQTFTVRNDSSDSADTVSFYNRSEAGKVKIKKLDAETRVCESNGQYSVVGTVFGVYSDTTSTSPVTTLTIGSDCTATSSDLATGTYYLREITPTSGYANDNTSNTEFRISSEGEVVETAVSGDNLTFYNSLIKGGICLYKVSNVNGNITALGGVEFSIASRERGESRTIRTDANGVACTGQSELKIGTYTVREVAGQANEAFQNTITRTVTISQAGAYYDADTGLVVVSPSASTLSAIRNSMSDNPAISTNAVNGADRSRGQTLAISTDETVADTVIVTGLEAGKVYRIESKLCDMSGAVVKSETLERTSSSAGSLNLTITFSGVDTSGRSGETLGVKTTLSKRSGEAWIQMGETHNVSLSDTDEMVTVDRITLSTEARGQDGETLGVGELVKVVDTVAITGLTNGGSYVLREKVLDASGSTVALADGSTEISETINYAGTTGGTGSYSVELPLNTTSKEGQTFTVVTRLEDSDGNVLAEHGWDGLGSFDESDREKQSVSVSGPQMTTKAENAAGGGKTLGKGDSVEIKDCVTLTGLVSGASYTVEGRVVRHNDTSVVVSATPEYYGGTNVVTAGDGGTAAKCMTFTVNTSAMEVGTELLVVQTLKSGNTVVLEHNDSGKAMRDSDQIVVIAEAGIETDAYDGAGSDISDKEIDASENTKIYDKVSYHGLNGGATYNYKMEVYSVTNTTSAVCSDMGTFTSSDSGNGEFVAKCENADTSALAGQALVVFETVSTTSGTVVAEHKLIGNIYDNPQVVFVKKPQIVRSVAETTNTSDNKKLKIGPTTFTDTVELSGFKEGDTYTVAWEVRNKTTGGDKLIIDGSEVSGSDNNCRPTVANPYCAVEIALDTSRIYDDSLDKIELVVYRRLYKHNDSSVVYDVHEDLHDLDQTVTLERIEMSTEAYDGTGSDISDKEIDVRLNSSVKDKVSISGLENGASYALESTLMDVTNGDLKAVGNPVCSNITADGSDPFIADTELTFNGAERSGHVLVVYQALKSGSCPLQANAAILKEHRQATDESEMVTVKQMSFETDAFDGKDSDESDKVIDASPRQKITDKITYSGLAAGETYYYRMEVWELNGNEENVTKITEATGSFEAEDTTSSPKYILAESDEFDATHLAGKTLVVYEYLYYGIGREQIGVHAANGDTRQQVRIEEPRILSTFAYDKEDGDSIVGVGQVTIIDEVRYSGLAENESYQLRWEVYEKSNTSDLVDYGRYNFNTGTSSSVEAEISFDTSRFVNGSERARFVLVQELYKEDSTGVYVKLDEHNADFSDDNEEVEVGSVTLETSAKSEDGTNVLGASSSARINDTVTYEGLVPGSWYRMKMKVMDVSGGTPVEVANNLNSENGNLGQSFQADATGRVVITSNAFSTAALAGKKVVVYEYLYSYDGRTLIESHEDPEDINQTLNVGLPEIGTIAEGNAWCSDSEPADARKKCFEIGTVTLKDTVHYEGLVPGEQYTLEWTLIDPTEGSGFGAPVVIDGVTITGEHNFTPAQSEGDEEVMVTIDTAKLFDEMPQMSLVFFEVLKFNGEVIASHEENMDSNQTVTAFDPDLRTTATDAESGLQSLDIGEVKIKDVVTYTGLVDGEKYILTTTVIDKATEQPVKDWNGADATKETEFTARGGFNQTTTVEMEVDTTDLQGAELVVYETLRKKDETNIIGRHEDKNDAGQTVSVKTVTIHTTATDKSDRDNVLEPSSGQVIEDKVTYTFLTEGETYTFYGVVVDKKASEAAGETVPFRSNDGALVTATTTKTIGVGEGSGYVTVTFELDASELAGREFVVFEYLFAGDSVGELDEALQKHASLTSDDQYIKVREKIGTEAVDEYDNDHEVGVGDAVVVDTVAYEGLKMGQKYVMRGRLIENRNGTIADAVVVKVGEEEVRAETEFVVGEGDTLNTSGTVQMRFEFNTKDYAGKKLVVFEELYEVDNNGVEEKIASHEEINDESQTVTISEPKLTTTALDKIDGDKELLNNSVAVITDHIEYSGLVKGNSYTIRGVLMNKETGEPVKNDEGEDIVVEYTFVAEKDKGSYDMEFELNTDGLSGKRLVVFEELFMGEGVDEGELIAEHKDINDEDQSVDVKLPAPNTGAAKVNEEGARFSTVAWVGVVVLIMGIGGTLAMRLRRKQKFGF